MAATPRLACAPAGLAALGRGGHGESPGGPGRAGRPRRAGRPGRAGRVRPAAPPPAR